jgi:two-component system, chemotaxis family, chemotaxis protein CheY
MAIFIVDDSSVVRSVVRKSLDLYGYKDVIEAIDGEEGMEKIKSNYQNIELYVLDVNMPKMDGITMVGEIRKLDTTTPIVMLTTESDKAKMMEAKGLGATGWIIKPFDAEKFIKVVQMFLKK